MDVGFLTLQADANQGVYGIRYFQIDVGSPDIADSLTLSGTKLIVDYLDENSIAQTTTRYATESFITGVSAISNEWYFDLRWVLTSVQFSGLLSPTSFALTNSGYFVSDGNVTGTNSNPGDPDWPFTILSVSSLDTNPVPEPSYMALLALGTAVLFCLKKR